MNEIQELNLRLIELSSFNNFNGQLVAADLRAHHELWRGVVMDRASYCFHGEKTASEQISLIKLRDIEDGVWNVDTLYILPVAEREEELEALAKEWGADTIGWMDKKKANRVLGGAWITNETKAILVCWWD